MFSRARGHTSDLYAARLLPNPYHLKKVPANLDCRSYDAANTPLEEKMKDKHRDTIKNLFCEMDRFIYEHPDCGKYYSGYGTGFFTCECYFDMLALFLADHRDIIQITQNFVKLNLMLQDESGHIPRHPVDFVEDPNRLDTQGWSSMSTFVNGKMVNPWSWYEQEEHAQPFLYQITAFATRLQNGDTYWITPQIYEGLKKYMDCWLNIWDRTGEGLSVIASAQHGISDNSFSRAGTWRSYYSQTPDFNALLYIELKCAAKIARALHQEEDAHRFEQQASIKKDCINELLWNEEAGCYFCRDIRTGQHIHVDAVNHYYPLYAGIVPADRAERMVKEHLFHESKLYSPYPFSSYAMDEQTYTQFHKNDTILLDDYIMLPDGHCNWRGGVWAHPHYLLVQSLKRYGYTQEAHEVADKIFELTIDNPYVCEWHNAETGEMQGAKIHAGAQILQRLMPAVLKADFDVDFVEDELNKPLTNRKVREALGLS